jgi:hypothetical protein
MSIKINRLEEGHNSYPLVCRRPILRSSKDLLDNLKSRSFSQVSSIKTLDFSTIYTTLPYDKLKTRLKETIHVKLKALASWIFLSFTNFWRKSDSYEHDNKSARRGAQFVPIGMLTTCWNSIPPKETNMIWQIKNPLKRDNSQSFQSKRWLNICCVRLQFHIFFKQNSKR